MNSGNLALKSIVYFMKYLGCWEFSFFPLKMLCFYFLLARDHFVL